MTDSRLSSTSSKQRSRRAEVPEREQDVKAKGVAIAKKDEGMDGAYRCKTRMNSESRSGSKQRFR